MTLTSGFSGSGAGRRLFTFFVLAFSALPSVEAVTVSIDLTTPPAITSRVDPVPFQELNGMPLSGETLSLDFRFSNSEFVRLFTVTSFSFEALINLQLNSSSSPGFLAGSGYLVDGQGNAIPGFGITGRVSGDDWMSLGLLPLWKDSDGTPNTDLTRPLDFYGVHYDLVFPDAQDWSIHVMGGTFTLFSDDGTPFGIGPNIPPDIVPDQGSSSLLLLSIGFLGPVLGRLFFPAQR